MGNFVDIMLFPWGERLECSNALKLAAEKAENELDFNRCKWQMQEGCWGVLLNEGCVGELALADITSGLTKPVLWLYIYDDDFWGYELVRQGKRLDQFASLANYFAPGEPPDKEGNALLFSICFGVAEADIEDYLTPWPEQPGEGRRAYAGDRFAIGDCWQLVDFLRALGFDYDAFVDGSCVAEPQTAEPVSAGYVSPYASKPRPTDPVELPNVLTYRPYALLLADGLGEEWAELAGLIRENDLAKALPLLTAAIQAQPEEAAFYLLRAFCYKQLEEPRGRRRSPEIKRDLTKALSYAPDNIWALRAHYPTTATSANYRQHIEVLNRLIELDPEYMDNYLVSRAYRYHWLEDDEAARQDLETVLFRDKLWDVDLVYLCRELSMPGF